MATATRRSTARRIDIRKVEAINLEAGQRVLIRHHDNAWRRVVTVREVTETGVRVSWEFTAVHNGVVTFGTHVVTVPCALWDEHAVTDAPASTVRYNHEPPAYPAVGVHYFWTRWVERF